MPMYLMLAGCSAQAKGRFAIKHLKSVSIAILSISAIGQGQQSALKLSLAAPRKPVSAVSKTPRPSTANTPLFSRWLDLNTLSYSSRFRSTTNWHGRHLFDFGQDRYVADGLFKLDSAAKYTVNFHGSTGRYFNWSYADMVGGQYKDNVVAARAYKTAKETADLKRAVLLDPNGATYSAGIPSRGGYFFFRELYFRAAPVKQVSFEFGSLPIEHGQNSEITSFDDDGYISGERVRFTDPKHLFFDQVAGTWAFLGSPLTPNFFARGADLTRSNYQQYLVGKNIGKYVAASTDFTLLNGTQTIREAAAFKTPCAKVIDGGRLELYQRLNTVTISSTDFTNGSGFAVSARKQLFHTASLEGGYAQIDERYAAYGGSLYLATVGFALNGDSYETGKRVFARSELKLARGVTAFGFYTIAVVPLTIGHNKQGLNAGINVDVKSLANTRKQIF